MTGWRAINKDSYTTVAPSIPVVTSGNSKIQGYTKYSALHYLHIRYCCYVGLLYTYLAGHLGKEGDSCAFRALDRGCTHWASGRLQQLENNVNHPEYCHVRCSMQASMKSNVYQVYMLFGRHGDLATILSATCKYVAGYVYVIILLL